ncbi:hypothetical protein Hanom_Chr04g00357951 [Helianthus anomalus]
MELRRSDGHLTQLKSPGSIHALSREWIKSDNSSHRCFYVFLRPLWRINVYYHNLSWYRFSFANCGEIVSTVYGVLFHKNIWIPNVRQTTRPAEGINEIKFKRSIISEATNLKIHWIAHLSLLQC